MVGVSGLGSRVYRVLTRRALVSYVDTVFLKDTYPKGPST